mmetsp:Transcript_13928/g.39099  ORF Transcript_13928/g.39099 Transcript_13928/m.39099 type:complete len:483 (+) Transcript_13928:107-1555(+)
MIVSPFLSNILATAATAAVLCGTIPHATAATLEKTFSEYDMTGGLLLPTVGGMVSDPKVSWFSSGRWVGHTSYPSSNDTVWIGTGSGDDSELYIPIDDGDAAVSTMVLSASDDDYGYVQMDILQDKKLTVGKDFVIGDGADSSLAVVYIGKGATVSVGGDLVVGGNAKATTGSGSGNGVLILAGMSSTLNVDGVLRVGGSDSSGTCGLGTVDLSGATKATISAQDLKVCNNQSRLIMAEGNALQLEGDRRQQIAQMISQDLVALSSDDSKSELSVNYSNGITTLSVESGCPEDVKLLKQNGASVVAASDPVLQAIEILHQNTTTVTVGLNQIWSTNSAIDFIYYAYRSHTEGTLKGWSGDAKCYVDQSVPFSTTGEPFKTIDITCNVLQPYAKLELCLVDKTDHGTLSPLTSTTIASIIPNCCYHDSNSALEGGVCYILDIKCSPPPESGCAESSVTELATSVGEAQRRRAITVGNLRKYRS